MDIYTLKGTLRGDLWWPQEPGDKQFETSFRRDADTDSIRAMVESVLDQERGDFSSTPAFLADSVLVIGRQSGRRHVEREFPLAMLPSVADYTSDEWPDDSEDW